MSSTTTASTLSGVPLGPQHGRQGQALIEAYAWVNVAASGDLEFREIAVVWTHEELAELREELSELMTSEEIAEAQRISLDLWERIKATD